MPIFKTQYKWKLGRDKQTKRHVTTTKCQQFIIGLFGNIYHYIVISIQCRALTKAALILVTSSGVIWWKRPFFQIGTETKSYQHWYCINHLVLKSQHSGKCRTLGLLMLRLFNYVACLLLGLCWEEFNYPRRTGHLSENKFFTRVIKGLLNHDYSPASFIVDRYGSGSTYPPLYNWLFSFKTVILFYHIDLCNCNIHAWNWSNTINI